MTPGREMVIVEKNGDWLRVFANTDMEEAHEADVPIFGQESAPPPVSGWIPNKGAVSAETPNGDVILFGQAATKERTRYGAITLRYAPPRMPVCCTAACNDIYPQSRWRLKPHGARRIYAGSCRRRTSCPGHLLTRRRTTFASKWTTTKSRRS